ncbi:Endonuclease/exonuclease/phosphatase [Corchorus olitorius]|uniref:Endonuclease/exonuclease/phosphatase n=1 Tax=Corchorus olitorius TaxID=93759 RepID=A0A1R3KTE3_9ROSI|nr:Endonuclease/exonuclease/phosphatase [Corchorus olitorius]
MEEIVLDLDVAPLVEVGNSSWSVLGKVVAEKSVNQGAIQSILRNLWPEKDLPIIGDVGTNLVNLVFTSEDLMKKALMENPCSVMGYSLNLKVWPPEKTVREVDLDSIPFWVQIHSLPRDMMIESNARKIRVLIGSVLEVEEPMGRFGINRSFFRLRVEIPANKPLLPGCWINRPGGNRAWAEIKYEKLFDFCFNCGRLGHGGKFCKMEVMEPQRFGPFMRAPPAKQLLSPGKQRSYSWDGGQRPWNGDWRAQKVARGLHFDYMGEKARELGQGGARVLGVQKETSDLARDSFGSAPNEGCLPIGLPEIPALAVDKVVTIEGSRSGQLVDGSLETNKRGMGPVLIGSNSNNSINLGLGGPDHMGRVIALTKPNEEIVEIYKPGVPELPLYDEPSPKKESSLSPVKMIRTMMNLSHVFRSLNLKRAAGEECELKRGRKKQRAVFDAGVIEPSFRSKDFTVDIAMLSQQKEEVSCFDLGSCVAQGKRKYRKRTGGRDGQLISERLDRILANGDWLKSFPDVQVFNLPALGSDHSPVKIVTKPEVP